MINIIVIDMKRNERFTFSNKNNAIDRIWFRTNCLSKSFIEKNFYKYFGKCNLCFENSVKCLTVSEDQKNCHYVYTDAEIAEKTQTSLFDDEDLKRVYI